MNWRFTGKITNTPIISGTCGTCLSAVHYSVRRWLCPNSIFALVDVCLVHAGTQYKHHCASMLTRARLRRDPSISVLYIRSYRTSRGVPCPANEIALGHSTARMLKSAQLLRPA